MTSRQEIEQTIAALEAQRAILGDAVVAPAVAALRDQLAALQKEAAAPPRQERKQVTVLFADIAGFTALSEKMDAEEVNDLLNALWQRLDAAVMRFGGLVDKHIGDALMALWGAGTASEDDAERAIRAALEMQTELANFRLAYPAPASPAGGLQLNLRVGIHSGPVLLGQVGSVGEFTAIGDTVNTASRIEHEAPIGGVLISHDTYRLVRGIFDVQAQQPVSVKGKTEPLQTYQVHRPKPRAFRMATRGVEGIETRMVGRSAQLNALQAALRQSIDDCQTCVMLLVGEAGIGKSRMLYEFENWLELQPDLFFYYKGRAAPATTNIPYSIIRDMFAFRFDILESDSPAAVLEKFRRGTASILETEQSDLVGHLIGFDFSSSPAVRNLLGSPYFGQQATAYLLKYLHLAAAQPSVIFLEDIHWADESSLDLLEEVGRQAPQARLFVLCLARPTLFERRPGLGQDIPAFEQILLQPLSRTESESLVAEILQKAEQVPDSLRSLVVEGAEGNPFYVEELIKMLIEDGVILRGDDPWQINIERLKRIRVPSTLTGVLQARLDGLPAAEKETLQRAAVVGRIFWDAAVAHLFHPQEAAASAESQAQPAHSRALAHLHQRELIFRRDRSAFAGTEEYIFKHTILHDVTYESVLLKLRHVYHAQVARWLETHAGERIGEYLGLIAMHYEHAGETALAANYLQRAGEELFKISAYRDAAAAFEQAMGLLAAEDLPRRAQLRTRLGAAFVRMSSYDRAVEILHTGLEEARTSHQTAAEIDALNELGYIAWTQGDYPTALQHLQPCLQLAIQHASLDGQARAYWSLGCANRNQGNQKEAVKYLHQSLDLYRALQDHHGIAYALNVLGMVAFGQQAFAEAEQYYTEALSIFRQIGERRGIFVCLNNLGVLARKQGRFAEARRHFEEILPIGQEINLRHGIAVCLVGLGLLCLETDERQPARQHLVQAIREALAVGAVPFILHALVGLAALSAREGQDTQAAHWLGLAIHHPAVTPDARQDAEPVVQALERHLSAQALQEAIQHGKTLDLDQTVQDILQHGGT